jgi:hypothetical protein
LRWSSNLKYSLSISHKTNSETVHLNMTRKNKVTQIS